MAAESQDSFELIQTKVKIDGYSSDIIFSNLTISQALGDVNSFSFNWRQEEGEPSLSAHVEFYKRYLSKEVTISIQSNFSFKGVIDSISCVRQDELGVEYEILGTGLFGKLNEVPQCNSFYKKSLTQIFNDVNKAQGTRLKLSPKNSGELFYTVQYNQTGFEFYKMLAIRYGEWLYYNGTEMVLGTPEGEAVKLKLDVDVHDIFINARARKAAPKVAGYDHYKGEAINANSQASSSGSGLIAASASAGDAVFGSNHNPVHFSNAANNQTIGDINKLNQKGVAASSVFISGTSHNSKIRLGGKINLTNRTNGSEGEYIVTEINHSCETNNNYQNHFVAIPADAEVPPYTDPLVFPICKSQPAKVVDNEDNDGLDRIKVQFPWQPEGSSSPWLSVLTPHAGKDKGFRFLPEKDEEVLVGFIDNNAEKPFVLGAVHTEKNKSNNDVAGNKQKVIGTQTGRRLEIDEENQFLQLIDNFKGKTPKNVLRLTRDDSTTQLMMMSLKSDNDSSVIQLNNSESLKIGLQEGGSIVAEILLEKQGNKITIHSKGSIEIKADQEISLSSGNISINASQELKLEGKAGVEIKGLKVAVEADTTADFKGLNTKVDGTAKLELSSAALASVEAALVKIN